MRHHVAAMSNSRICAWDLPSQCVHFKIRVGRWTPYGTATTAPRVLQVTASRRLLAAPYVPTTRYSKNNTLPRLPATENYLLREERQLHNIGYGTTY
jgi:hypothetical protein